LKKLVLFYLAIVFSMHLHAQLNIQLFMDKGKEALFENRFTEAIQMFNQVIRSKPDLAEPHFYRGVAKYYLGDYRGAEFDYTRSIILDNYNPFAFHYRGVARANLFDYNSAFDDFRKSIALKPGNPYVYLSRGLLYLQQKKFRQAVSDFDTVLLYNSGIEDAYLQRAIAFLELKEPEKARADCSKALKINILNPDAFLKRGIIRAEMNDLEGAMNDFTQAIRLDGENPLIYYQRAVVWLKNNDTTAALKDFNRVLTLDPRNALTWYNRAMIRFGRDQYDDAINDLTEAMKINRDNIYVYYNRGIAFLKTEKPEDAIQDFSSAMQLYPDFAPAYLARSDAYEKTGNKELARQDYDLAIAIINAVNSGEDRGLMNRNFAMDSTYFKKIIALEADFNSGQGVAGRIQNMDVEISLKPDFIIYLADNQRVIQHLIKTGYKTGNLRPAPVMTESFGYLISSEPVTIKESDLQFISNQIDSTLYFNPFNGDAYFLKGIINAQLQNFEQARTAFSRAAELDPENWAALLNKGHIEFLMAELSFANSSREAFISILPSQPDPAIRKTETHIDLSTALEEYTAVLVKNPQSGFAWYNRGNIRVRQRDFRGALADYNQAIAMQPNLAEAFFNRALTLIYLNDKKMACLDLSKAAELGITEGYNLIKRFCSE